MDVPEVLYHYTTTEGLIGIIGSGELWASYVGLMNDREETVTASRILSAEYETAVKDPRGMGPAASTWEDAATHGDTLLVCCFSESGDALEMWRGYAPDGGYAIGFHAARLSELQYSDTRATHLFRVEYDEVVFRTQVQSAFGPDSEGRFGGSDIPVAFALSGGFKESAWSSEKEWRLALQDHTLCLDFDEPTIHFRSGRYGPLPYARIPFSTDLIRSVRIGPGVFESERRQGVEYLLYANGLPDVDILGTERTLR